ncbi:unnamed protein product [Malus baccata var. baccata]
MAALGKTDEFELHSSLLHHIPKFHGMSMEDPNKHLKEFEVVCSSMTPVNIDGSILKMKAKDWLYELAPGTVTSWESMKRAFLEKFFPTSRVILLCKRISGIQQNQGESFPTYYGRFKTLVASCPQHQMKEELLLQYFYEWLLPIERQMLDTLAGRALVEKTLMAAKTLIANQALNAQQYEDVGQRDTLRQQVNEMAEGMRMKEPSVCGVYSIQGHASEKCPQLIENGGWESANAIEFQGHNQQRNDPYSNTYNPGWRNHPNFKWREPQQPQQPEGFRQQPPGFYTKQYAPTQAPQQPAQNTSVTHQFVSGARKSSQNNANQDKMVDQMEKQIGQIAEFVGQFREQGKLPSSTVVNPNGGFESAKAMSLRSGQLVGSDPQPSNSRSNEVEELIIEEQEQSTPMARVETPLSQALKAPKPSNLANKGKEVPILINSNVIPPNVPFPRRFMQSKKEEAEKDILETFRKFKSIYHFWMQLSKFQVHVNHLIFPVDFYVLEMDESDHSPTLPILLGRPFMKTARTKINVFNGTLAMEFDGEVINFNLSDSIKYPSEDHSCFSIDAFASLAQDHFDQLNDDALELVIA